MYGAELSMNKLRSLLVYHHPDFSSSYLLFFTKHLRFVESGASRSGRCTTISRRGMRVRLDAPCDAVSAAYMKPPNMSPVVKIHFNHIKRL